MQFLDKVVLERAGVNMDKVVDVPVIMQLQAAARDYIDMVVGVPVVMRRRSLHASSTKAFGRLSPYHSRKKCYISNSWRGSDCNVMQY